MNAKRALRMLPLLGALALPACDADRVTDPMDGATELSAEDLIALDVITDAGAVQAALDLIDVPVETAARHGQAWGMQSGTQENAQRARERFQEALQLLNQHDSVQAAVRAREARQLVVRAMVGARGGGAMAGLIDRAQGLADAVAREPAMYNHAYQLQAELGDLALRARQRFQFRDSTGAGECAVLAEQRHRQRQLSPAARPGGAEAAVELAFASVSLATNLVEANGTVDDAQTRLLAVAADYADAAQTAFDAGQDAWAVHLSDLTHWLTLEAVVWPDGVSPDEAAALLDLAETRYADATATTPTGTAADLLEWAGTLIDFGSSVADPTRPGAVGALWHAAVICTWIIG